MRFRFLLGLLAIGIVTMTSFSSTGCAQKKAIPPAPPPPTVTVAKAFPFNVKKYLEFNGYLEAVETVQITARVKGFLNKIEFVEGAEVEKGKLLFEIDPREYNVNRKKAAADQLKALAEVKRTTAEEARARQLLTTQAMSMEDFQQRVANRETAEAALKQAEAAIEMAEIELGYTKIYAKIDGQINRTLVTKGNLVGNNENTLLTTIVGVDELYVYFDVPERDLIDYQRSLREKPQAVAEKNTQLIYVGLSTEQGYPHTGILDYRENKVDTGTGTVRLRGRLKNPKMPPGNVRLLYPGLYARVRIPLGEQTQFVIPEDALLTGQEGRFVYVIDDKNLVQKRTLKLGANVWRAPAKPEQATEEWSLINPKAPVKKEEPKPKDAPPKKEGPPATPSVRSVVAVDDGLKEGDLIIVDGLQRARPGAPVTPEVYEFRGPKDNPPIKK